MVANNSHLRYGLRMEDENKAPAAVDERNRKDKDRRFARDIAYGIQQTIACWATDFIDPPVSKFLQNTFGNKKHHVTDAHTFGGEAIGDTAALGIFLGAKRFLGKPIDGVIAMVKRVGDPILTKMGKAAIKPWAEGHGVDEKDERYKKKLEEYKDFQAENMVDSSIISVSATGVNVLAQRQLGNKQSYGTILGSKMVGATLTLGLMGLLRIVFPTSTRALDDEISDRYSSKVIKWTKKALGVKEDKQSSVLAQLPVEEGVPAVMTPEKREGLMAIVVEDAVKIDFRNPEAFAKLIAHQKEFYEAFLKALGSDNDLRDAMVRGHYETVKRRYGGCFDHNDGVSRQCDKDASRESVDAAMAVKRAELKQFIALLDNQEFLEEAKKKTAAGIQPQIRQHELSAAEKDALTSSLLAAAPQYGKDPVNAVFEVAERKAIDYEALAHANDPNGVATSILASTMKKLLPDRKPDVVERVARDYMTYYSRESQIMADAFKPDAGAVKNAVQRAKQLHEEYRATNHVALAV